MSDQIGYKQVNEFLLSLESAGWSKADIDAVTKSKTMREMFLAVIRGQAHVGNVSHVIDCDAKPFEPSGLTVVEHAPGGKIIWDSSKIDLRLEDGQKGGKCIEGNKLRKLLKSKRVLNANVLDYLLAHSELIPESWKGNAVFFWGTIYRNADGNQCVRYLYWGDGRWYSHDDWLGRGWGSDSPAALLAS